jgi:STE24 endopeptidase
LFVSITAVGAVVAELLPGLLAWAGSGASWVAGADLAEELPRAFADHRYLPALPVVAALLAYIFVVFGFLSRRCERQADVFGCRAVSCGRPVCAGHVETPLATAGRGLCPTGIRTFIRALDKVAQVNGLSRDRPGFLQSWQHSTIARRVAFLEEVLADPSLEPRFQRRVALVKWGLFLAVGVLALLAGVGGWSLG